MMTTADTFAAIKNGDLDALTASLNVGTDQNATDSCGYTLLMKAVYRNQLHMVDVLLSRGADVHRKDWDGCTALHWAAYTQCSDVFRRIFSEAGPRGMNLQNCRGWTPLHYLACTGSGSAEQMAFALSHPGIDVSLRCHDGHRTVQVASCFWADLQTYGDQEARWQPLRCTWIKLLMIQMRR
jgi:hypothetical protein